MNTAARPDIASGENSDQVLHRFRDRIVELRRLIVSLRVHCKNSMVILTNKNGYLSFTFVLSTLGTEQRYKECVGYHPGGTEW